MWSLNTGLNRAAREIESTPHIENNGFHAYKNVRNPKRERHTPTRKFTPTTLCIFRHELKSSFALEYLLQVDQVATKKGRPETSKTEATNCAMLPL